MAKQKYKANTKLYYIERIKKRLKLYDFVQADVNKMLQKSNYHLSDYDLQTYNKQGIPDSELSIRNQKLVVYKTLDPEQINQLEGYNNFAKIKELDKSLGQQLKDAGVNLQGKKEINTVDVAYNVFLQQHKDILHMYELSEETIDQIIQDQITYEWFVRKYT